jgi:AAA domain
VTAANLGQFSEGFASWRHILAVVQQDDRPTIFANAAAEAATFVARGLDKVVAADELTDMAVACGLDNFDSVQATIADAFKTIDDTDSKIKFNGGQEPRLSLKAFKDIAMSTVPSYLVKGVIPRTGIVIVWGPPKCGKSFWTFDLVMHVALGWPYRGRRVQQATVLYLALEGGHGFRNRVEAWRRRHLAGHRGDVPFYLLDVPVDLVADRDKLIEAVRAQLGDRSLGAVIIDTLNRALIGDENKSEDMSRFIRAADLIRAVFGCVVIIIHHSGVAGTRPRGHTSLSGADDAQIAIERNETGIVTVKIEHMKDGDASAPMASRLERVDLGDDDEGDKITSCVVEPVDDAMAGTAPKLTGATKLALDQLRGLIADLGERPPASNYIPQGPDILICPATLWREHFYQAHIGTPDSKQKAFVRASVRLEELGLIGIWSDKVWLAGHTGHARTK